MLNATKCWYCNCLIEEDEDYDKTHDGHLAHVECIEQAARDND